MESVRGESGALTSVRFLRQRQENGRKSRSNDDDEFDVIDKDGKSVFLGGRKKERKKQQAERNLEGKKMSVEKI